MVRRCKIDGYVLRRAKEMMDRIGIVEFYSILDGSKTSQQTCISTHLDVDFLADINGKELGWMSVSFQESCALPT